MYIYMHLAFACFAPYVRRPCRYVRRPCPYVYIYIYILFFCVFVFIARARKDLFCQHSWLVLAAWHLHHSDSFRAARLESV